MKSGFIGFMTGLEGAVIWLGAAVVKSASRIWLGDKQFAADMAAELTDALAGQLTSTFDRRRVGRFFDDCADIVAKRLAVLLTAEFAGVPSNEREAAVLAVRDTFARAPLTDEKLFQADLDARLVERQLRPTATRVLDKALLSGGGESVYWLVLRESCAYLVEVVTTLPRFGVGALTELLRRETLILSTLSRVLDRLPERRGANDFTVDYRRVVANKLDRLELFGVTIADANRRYPLSIAYIDLSIIHRGGSGGGRLISVSSDDASSGVLRAETVLAADRVALIVGPAGSGKTTLLQWLAVRSAQGDFTGPLADLNGTVPFFIPLRRYVDRSLPAPEEFPAAIGANIVHEMPRGWVHDLLRAGRALVLVDGVDEMPATQRNRVDNWLNGLVDDFPQGRFLMTSRPSAIGDMDSLRTAVIELQPMSMADVAEFVRRWHEAVGSEALAADERASLGAQELSLLAAVENDRHLRGLAVTPLLCALLCALNRERNAHLPTDRMETYAAALDMLLDRRDRERGVDFGAVRLSNGDKVQLLQDIAFWFVRNGWSDAPVDRVIEQVARTVRQLRGVTADAGDVYSVLLERSGLLREPVVGQVDFLHRTFQEYLAGKAAVEDDEIGLLVRNADDDQWREVVVMAAGHAQPEQCAEILRGLLASGGGGIIRRGRSRGRGIRLRSLAIACAYTARRIDPGLRAQVEKVAEQLVPPATDEVAEALAGIGEDIFVLLHARPPRTAAQAVASIRAVSIVGGAGALQSIGEILVSGHHPLSDEVAAAALKAWRYFKPDEYMAQVLVHGWPPDRELRISEPATLEVLHQFGELTSVRCDLDNLRFAQPDAVSVSRLAQNAKLRSVRLTDCLQGLNLSPLLRLRLLETLALDCEGRLPDITVLSRAPGLHTLAVRCEGARDSLRPIARFTALRRLKLVGCNDVTSLDGVTEGEQNLEALSLTGFMALNSLAGIKRWNCLRTLEILECPRVTDLAPLAGLLSLESASIGLLRMNQLDLSPLAGLPHLRELSLLGQDAFDLTTLRGKGDLVVRVPAHAKLTGADGLGPGSAVVRFMDAPWTDIAGLGGT
jgi:hypothetical protein